MKTRMLVLSVAPLALAAILSVPACSRQTPARPPTVAPTATTPAPVQSSPNTVTPPATATPGAPIATAPSSGQPPSAPSPTSTSGQASPVAPATSASTGITLQVKEPQDESIVTTSPIVVRGVVPIDATVSVNEDVVDVAENGTFTANVNLQEGPNFIDVVASDFDGNEASQVITVMYIP